MIDNRFKELRVNVGNSAKSIIDNILDNHYDPNNFAGKPEICIFCGSPKSLTKEHVMPKWVFQNDPIMFFRTNSNEIDQTFNKSTVPACKTCNTTYLSYIERHIQILLKQTDFDTSANESDLLNILRWMEIIEYKFHVLEFRRKYRASKSKGYEPILSNVPLSILRSNIRYSPYKATEQLRQSQKRVTIKNKEPRFHSLITFGLSDPESHFIHSMNNFLFFSLPQFNKALFYFFNEEFDDYAIATQEARRIIKEVYTKEKNDT